MMSMVMCSIYDAKAEAFMSPMTFQAKGQAVRSFADAVNKEDSEFNKHPEDYSVFLLGTFDPKMGKIEVQKSPISLAIGINLIERTED